MKLGFLVNCNENLEVWTKVADSMGIEGIDLTFATKEDYHFDAENVCGLLQNRRVKLCAVSMFHENTLSGDEKIRARARRKNQELIQFAKDTQSPIAVINPGLLEGAEPEENIAEFKEQFAFYKEYSEKLGVQIVYYLGHNPNFIKSSEILDRVLEEIPEMCIKVDPVGVIRNMSSDPYEVVSAHADRIRHFHCKDIIRRENYEIEPPVGMGELKWNQFIAMLYEKDYDGYLVIEPHGPKWRNEEKMCDYIRLSQRCLEKYIL